MTVTMSMWTRIYNAFDPYRPVPPEKIDAWFVERPASPLLHLLTDLDPGRLPSRSILVGQLSSGKSTELVKVATELRRRHDYFVVLLDLDESLDIEKANPVEVVFLMGAAVYKVATAELRGDPPPVALMNQLSNGLETIVKTQTANRNFSLNLAEVLGKVACYGASLLGGPVGTAVAEVAERTVGGGKFVSGTDAGVVRKLEVEPQIERMVERLNELIADVQARSGRSLVLVVDGLDKIRDPDLIELNFAEKKFLADPACRVVYSGPIDLYYSPRFAGVRSRFPIRPFPNVKLRTSDAPPRLVESGYAMLREVVDRRLASLGLSRAEAIDTPALDALIAASAGVVRDLVAMVREATTEADIAGKVAIDVEAAARTILARRRLYAVQLSPKYRAVLDRVKANHARTDNPECDELLRAGLILNYINDLEEWFDVHAILDWTREGQGV